MYAKIIKWTILVATVVTIAINLLSDVILIGGRTTAQISDSFKVYFVPAGYVFSIWGIIYVLLILYSFYQLSRTENKLSNIAPWYLVSCFANCAWIILWHYEQFGLTVIFMLILLLALIAIYLKIGIGTNVSNEEKYMLHVPFSVYLGWISVATLANITIFLSSAGFSGFGIAGQVWAAVLILLAFLLGFVILIRHNDYAFGLVIVWATVGIGVKFNGADSLVSSAGFAAGLTLLVAIIIKYFQFRNKAA